MQFGNAQQLIVVGGILVNLRFLWENNKCLKINFHAGLNQVYVLA